MDAQIQQALAEIEAEKAMRRNRSIPFAIKRRLWTQPCAICARPDDNEVDHIVAVSDGGGREESNLQPLCRVCNVLKRYHKTNERVAAWIKANPQKFQQKQQYRTRRAALKMAGEWF